MNDDDDDDDDVSCWLFGGMATVENVDDKQRWGGQWLNKLNWDQPVAYRVL